ncbi:PP2C family protein-serine/threonine phosphatase [Rhizocola hellebori]|nr:PP2C family protein-serine/threonine phosphatase [Rhizocola hellebori]
MQAGHWWVPLIDDTERLGVVEFVSHRPVLHGEDLGGHGEVFASLLAHLLATKVDYGDVLHRVRRTRPMATSGELLLAMLPPSTFACRELAISAILEPAYEVGGDGFDYAVDQDKARFLVLDAMGHGLQAALTTATVLATMRSARRDGQGLYAMAAAADTVLTEHFGDLRFVTAVLAELDVNTGALRYINAGHPPPVVVREHQVIADLHEGRRMPLGLGDGQVDVAELALQPGDSLFFYTDGVVEARSSDGTQFGLQRLVDLAERHAAADLPAPETLRRISQSIRDHRQAPPADDATMMLVEWSPLAARRTRP